MPDAAIRAKVEDYLKKSNALEVWWQRPITSAQLQSEMERMARASHQPEVLRELFSALGNDPMRIAECLARRAIVDRLIRNLYARDERFHGALRRSAEEALDAWSVVPDMNALVCSGGRYDETVIKGMSGHGNEIGAAEPEPGVREVDEAEWQVRTRELSTLFSSSGPFEEIPVGVLRPCTRMTEATSRSRSSARHSRRSESLIWLGGRLPSTSGGGRKGSR